MMISPIRFVARNIPFVITRSFANVFLGNELQRNLRQLYLLVHPDVMSAFPESVKEANKNSLQVRCLSISFCRC